MKTCAVVIAARNAGRWIDECLTSIATQQPLDGWKYDVRVGVDGCLETAFAIKGWSYWWSNNNIGPYVMRNSLVAQGPADAFAIFDADDVMMPSYLSTLIPLAGEDGIAGGGRLDIREDGILTGRKWKFVSGVAVFSEAAWHQLGGYRPWPVIADHDIIQRAYALRIPVRNHRDPLYKRRRHLGSLSAHATLGVHSAIRETYRRQSCHMIQNGLLHANRQVVSLESR